MAQTARRRTDRVWSLKRESGEDGTAARAEERLQALWDSPAGLSLRRGLPVFALCAFAAQGELMGGAMPFAPALLAAAMMRGKAMDWAAAGCVLGALIAGSPGALLACALLYLLGICLRASGLRPNDLACVLAAGLSSYLMPLLFVQDAYGHLMAGAGAVTVMVLARMYASALRLRLRDRELLSPEELISLTLLFAGVTAGFRSVSLWGVSPVRAGMLLVCMVAGHLGGAGLGAAVGALTGLMLGVTSPAEPWFLCGLVMLGLLSGVFSRMGRWWVAACAPVAAVLAGVLDARFLTWSRAVELLAAIASFLCIRQPVWDRLRVFVDREAQVRHSAQLDPDGLRAGAAEKLREYAALYGRMGRAAQGGGQFAAVSGALNRIAVEMDEPVRPLPELAHQIAQALDAQAMRAESVQAQKTGDRLVITLGVPCRRRDGLCDVRLTQAVSQAAGVSLRVRPTGVCPRQGVCRLTLEEACRFEISEGSCSRSSEEGAPCGDTLTTVHLPDGLYMAALADGMGHGDEAQRESRAAVELMEDFLLARFEPEAALHGVNDLLLSRGGECFSTMDLMLIDLAQGTLKAMKIGAVSSYVRRGRRVIEVGGDALPMGIVEKVKPSVTQMQLQDGDVLVLLSDGVVDAVDADASWLQAEIQAIDARAPEQSARRLIERAAQVGRHRDDMTVCILRLVRRAAP